MYFLPVTDSHPWESLRKRWWHCGKREMIHEEIVVQNWCFPVVASHITNQRASILWHKNVPDRIEGDQPTWPAPSIYRTHCYSPQGGDGRKRNCSYWFICLFLTRVRYSPLAMTALHNRFILNDFRLFPKKKKAKLKKKTKIYHHEGWWKGML